MDRGTKIARKMLGMSDDLNKLLMHCHQKWSSLAMTEKLDMCQSHVCLHNMVAAVAHRQRV
jgi:hypothetical protein